MVTKKKKSLFLDVQLLSTYTLQTYINYTWLKDKGGMLTVNELGTLYK